MGVTGCGKSTLGRALAQARHCPFVEGDTPHPPANIAKMTAGIPRDDADRIPFLENVARAIASRSGPLVISCSALTRAYRDQLRLQALESPGPEELVILIDARARLDRQVALTLAAQTAAGRYDAPADYNIEKGT